MRCPECKGTATREGDPIKSGGATLYPWRCSKCKYLWSDKKNPALATEPVVVIPEAPQEPAPPEASEPEPAADEVLVEVENPDEIEIGSEVEFGHEAETKRGVVVTNQPGAKTLQIDVDGRPDLRIEKSAIRFVVMRG